MYYSYAAANLRRTGFDAESGTLYLYFKDATADSDDNLLKAGETYLIKWPSGGTDITDDLTFEGVKVIASPQTFKSEDGNVSFNGTFTPTAIAVGDKSSLFLGTGKNNQDQDVSMLYYPDGSNYESFGLVAGDAANPDAPQNNYYLGAFRAYFRVDLTGGQQARQFVLNFGDDSETSGIENVQCSMVNVQSESWYTLDGRHLSDKPAKKGLYINNGKKVVIK